MNLIEQMNVLKGLDDAMLQQEVKAPSGSVPPYLVLSEMNRRKDMRQRYEGELARRKPQTTVAADMMAGLQPGGPMAAAPAIDPAAMGSGAGIAAAAPGGGSMQPPGFADGGIVDFASIAKRYNDKLSGLDDDRDRARALALIAASAGMLGGGHSNTLQNVGLGIDAGVKSYGDAINTIDSRETDLLRNLTDLDLTQQDKAFREREFAYRQANDAADRAAKADAARDKYSATTIFGVDENGNEVSARTNLTTGEYKPNPRADGTIPATFIPYSADELTTKREQAKVDVAKVKGLPAETAGVTDSLRQASTAMDTIKRAYESLNWANTGPIGAISGALPGGGWATDARALITTLKSGLAASALQAMRDASKTGGALGNVSDKDLELLQSKIANLDPNQSEGQLKEQLKVIYDELNAALQTRVNTFGAYYKDTPGVDVPQLDLPPPTFEEFMSVDVENDPMDSLVDKYRTK
jgi:hypothetical protein